MKRKLTKAAWEALSKELQALYKVDGDIYILELEADPDNDPGELRRARDREKEAAKLAKERAEAAEKKLKDIEDANGEEDLEAARKAKDIKALEKSYQDKLTAQKTESDNKLAAANKQIEKLLVSDRANQIAAKIAGDNAHLLAPVIATRLKADLTGDEPTTRVIDEKGNLTALSLDELSKEFVDNKKYSAIVISSKASGGAASAGNGKRPKAVPQDKPFKDLTSAERIEWHKQDPEGFKAASDEANKPKY